MMNHDPANSGNKPSPNPADESTIRDSSLMLGGHNNDPLIGCTVGQYIIKQAIGAGGMGSVYEAMQQSPRRTVALKMMRIGISSKNALRRFEYEAQALGRLRHPNIAQIYEAGNFDDGAGGRPWFAMEMIVGKKELTTYCSEKKLDNRAKLKIFKQICDAVQHGHQKGIIHRDLKPSNILVTSSGVPKIIDFGVARSTDSDMAVTTLQTDVGAIIGTLQYMSPEQCAADPADIDTRSDIYALGVILYELLCETVPYNVAKVAIHEAARIVQQEPPTKPSTFDKRLRGDIETITLKAMEKDRDRRYQSATELEKDIERYLSGEPIAAKAPSAMDYLKRFTRKHKGTAASIAAVFLVLIAAVVAISIFAYKNEQERKRSDALRQTAEEANTSLQHALDANMMYAQREADVQLQLSNSVERAEELLVEARRQAYYGNMHAAAAAVDRNETTTGHKRLADARIAFGDVATEDLPFEWQYYSARNDDSIAHMIAHDGSIQSIAYNANGTKLLSCGDRRTQIYAWDASTGRLLEKDTTPHDASYQAISPDGRWQARCSKTGPVHVYDIETNEVLVTLDRDDRKINKIIFSEDGNRIVLEYSKVIGEKAVEDIQVWDAQNGEMLARIHGGNRANVISPDGTLFGCTSLEQVSPAPLIGPIVVYDASTGELINKFGHQERPLTYDSIAFDHTGTKLAGIDFSKSIHIFDIRSGNLLQTMETNELSGNAGRAGSFAFSPNDAWLALGSPDGSIHIWNSENGELLITLRGHEHRCDLLAFSPDGMQLASGDQRGDIRIWSLRDLGASHLSVTHPTSDYLVDFKLSPDGTQFVRCSSVQGLRVMDTMTGVPLLEYGGEGAKAVYNDDGTLLAALINQNLLVFDTRTGEVLAETELGDVRDVSLLFTPDDSILSCQKQLAEKDAGNSYSETTVWDWYPWDASRRRASFQRVEQTLKSRGLIGNGYLDLSLHQDPAGKYLLCAADNSWLLLLFDSASGELLNTESLSGESRIVVFSPTGDRIATSNGQNNEIVIRSVPELEVLSRLEGPDSRVITVAFHPDGRRLASSSGGSKIRIWDLESGENVAVLSGNESFIGSLSFNPQGTWLISSGNEFTEYWPIQSLGRFKEDRYAAQVRASQLSPLVETWIEKANGDHEVLLAMLEREQRRRPEEEARAIGNVLLKSVTRKNRIEEFDDLVEQNWDNVTELNQLAWNVVISEDPILITTLSESCLRAAKQACELSSYDQSTVLDTLARVYYERGELDQAVHWQKKAVETAATSQQFVMLKALHAYQAEAGNSNHTSVEPSVP